MTIDININGAIYEFYWDIWDIVMYAKVIEEREDPEIANTIIVRFDNGTVGRLRTYPEYPHCSVITKNGYELLYANKNAALKALAEYLLDGTESQVALLKKRCTLQSQNLAGKYWR